MPIARFEMPDGRIGRFEVPEGTTPEQAQSMIAESMQQMPATPQPLAPASATFQKAQASLPGRVLQGMRDPIDAAASLVPHTMETVTSLGGFKPNKVSQFFGEEAAKVDALNTQNEQAYESARQAAQPKGIGSLVTGQQAEPEFDWARLAGNVVSPMNAAIATRAPIAAKSLAGKGAQGALMGGVGGLFTPTNDLKEGQSYWGTKAAQAGLGAVTGGIATPAMSSLGEAVARRWNSLKGNIDQSKVTQSINAALEDLGQKITDYPQAALQDLRSQVTDAFKSGKKIDPAALMRQKDFSALEIPPTQGQLTRDATQFAKERNLRGVAGVGEPLMNLFQAQNQGLQKQVGQFADEAGNRFQAGEKLAEALKRFDDVKRQEVSGLYQAARKSSGKDVDVPLTGLSQDYAETVRNFGDKVPSGVRNRFEELGLLSGNQKKVFSVEDAESVLKTINDNVSNDPATNKALDALRGAVKNAVLSADDQGGVFAKARTAAAQRFALQDAVPALKAASMGDVASDDFVKKFVINGKTNDVKGLADVLRQSDASAFDEAKRQIGETLKQAAFGENTAGDKLFTPDRYAKALRELGPDKLKAFFSPEEVEKLSTIGRVGSYINATPTAAPVNTSNTAGAAMNLLSRLPGIPAGAALVNAARNTINNQGAVRRGLSGKVPESKSDLTPEQISYMVKLLSGGGLAAGGMAATPLR